MHIPNWNFLFQKTDRKTLTITLDYRLQQARVQQSCTERIGKSQDSNKSTHLKSQTENSLVSQKIALLNIVLTMAWLSESYRTSSALAFGFVFHNLMHIKQISKLRNRWDLTRITF